MKYLPYIKLYKDLRLAQAGQRLVDQRDRVVILLDNTIKLSIVNAEA